MCGFCKCIQFFLLQLNCTIAQLHCNNCNAHCTPYSVMHRPQRWSNFQSDGMVNVFFRPPLTSMVFQWFWYRWTITIECFWRAQPLVSMVFQWFLKFWGQWSTMVWRLTMVCTYHRTKKCVKSIHNKMQISSRARKWTSQNISSLDPFKPYIQYNREKATFQ